MNVKNGLHVPGGGLGINQAIGSVVTLDGNDQINFGGTVADISGGESSGAAVIVNGTLTVGAVGANTLNLDSVAGIGGSGVIRPTCQNDTTTVGSVYSGVRFDVRAGNLVIASSSIPESFFATIGPAAGSGAASLGPAAEVNMLGSTFLWSRAGRKVRHLDGYAVAA